MITLYVSIKSTIDSFSHNHHHIKNGDVPSPQWYFQYQCPFLLQILLLSSLLELLYSISEKSIVVLIGNLGILTYKLVKIWFIQKFYFLLSCFIRTSSAKMWCGAFSDTSVFARNIIDICDFPLMNIYNFSRLIEHISIQIYSSDFQYLWSCLYSWCFLDERSRSVVYCF